MCRVSMGVSMGVSRGRVVVPVLSNLAEISVKRFSTRKAFSEIPLTGAIPQSRTQMNEKGHLKAVRSVIKLLINLR